MLLKKIKNKKIKVLIVEQFLKKPKKVIFI